MDTNPSIVVIMGATGDLAQKKLLPALLKLHAEQLLSPKTHILAFSRRPWDDGAFHAYSKPSLLAAGISNKTTSTFLKRIRYVQGQLNDPHAYVVLKQQIEEVEKSVGGNFTKIYFLSVSPDKYETVSAELGRAGLAQESTDAPVRLLVEKPFGKDLLSAKKLERSLLAHFKEHQVWRIDHYLAKEPLQSMLVFRLSNPIIASQWDRKHIASIRISLLEKKDIEGRADFYDTVGALRDVGQNHLLQMFALAAMNPPREESPAAIRAARSEALMSLRLSAKNRIVRGQYEGYHDEEGVQPNSDTETYFRLEAASTLSRWKGVPFILEAGKAMEESRVEVAVTFLTPPGMCGNMLRFKIQPDPAIELVSAVRKTIANVCEERTLTLVHEFGASALSHDAYARLFFDAIRGDSELFPAMQEINASWKFTDTVVRSMKSVPLVIYSQGTDPEQIRS